MTLSRPQWMQCHAPEVIDAKVIHRWDLVVIKPRESIDLYWTPRDHTVICGLGGLPPVACGIGKLVIGCKHAFPQRGLFEPHESVTYFPAQRISPNEPMLLTLVNRSFGQIPLEIEPFLLGDQYREPR